MSEYFPEPKSLEGKVKVKLNLSNYATKTDLNNATGVDTSKFAKKVDLANLKSNVDKIDIDKLKNVPSGLSSLKSKVDKIDIDKLLPAPVDLSKLSDVVKDCVIKKDVHNAQVKNTEDQLHDITNLATKTTLNAKINEVKGEISSINNLATATALNAKINEIKNIINNFTNLANSTTPTAVENKIPNVSNLVKKTKTNDSLKINEIEKKILDHDHDKRIAKPEFDKLTGENFLARLKRKTTKFK